ncbi:MAG: ATP-binding protein [Sulfolobales archaeon]
MSPEKMSSNVREISSSVDRKYRALLWTGRDFKSISISTNLANRIYESILSMLSSENLNEDESDQGTLRRIRVLTVREQYRRRDIFISVYSSILKIAYVDLPMILKTFESFLSNEIICLSAYYVQGGMYREITGVCGGRICESASCKSGRIRPLIAIISEEDLSDRLQDLEIDLFENFVEQLTALERRLIELLGLEKISYPAEAFSIKWIRLKKSESEAVEVVIREGFDNLVIKLDLRKPTWDLLMFPRKIASEIETLVVNPIKKNYKFAPRGVLLIGPPGVGKSVLAEAVASSIGRKILDLKPSVYRSMWYGMTEKILDRILRSITSRRDIALLIDDAEFLVGRSLAIHEVHISEISILLNYLQNPSRPIVLLTSNTPALIDQALLRPGRIDVTIVLGYPDRESRRMIVENVLKNYGVENYSEDIVEEIVRRTRWFSSAEIDSLIRMILSKGEGRIDIESLEWARKRFKIDPNARASEQQLLRWSASTLNNLVIQHIPDENEI